jgi:hypothetical protein
MKNLHFMKKSLKGLQYRLFHLTGISRQELIQIQNANSGNEFMTKLCFFNM